MAPAASQLTNIVERPGLHAFSKPNPIRRSSNDMAKDLEKEGVAEDVVKKLQEEIQKLTDKYIDQVDKIVVQKEKDIMTV